MDSYAQCLHSNPRSRVSRDSRDTVWLRDIWDRICVIERQLGLGVLNIKERSIVVVKNIGREGGCCMKFWKLTLEAQPMIRRQLFSLEKSSSELRARSIQNILSAFIKAGKN